MPFGQEHNSCSKSSTNSSGRNSIERLTVRRCAARVRHQSKPRHTEWLARRKVIPRLPNPGTRLTAGFPALDPPNCLSVEPFPRDPRRVRPQRYCDARPTLGDLRCAETNVRRMGLQECKRRGNCPARTLCGILGTAEHVVRREPSYRVQFERHIRYVTGELVSSQRRERMWLTSPLNFF